jgi:hypothetical protein
MLGRSRLFCNEYPFRLSRGCVLVDTPCGPTEQRQNNGKDKSEAESFMSRAGNVGGFCLVSFNLLGVRSSHGVRELAKHGGHVAQRREFGEAC